MAERNAQFLQIGLGHIGQDFEIDGILGKGSRVLGEPDPIKPGFYLVIVAHCRVRPPKVLLRFPFKFTPHIALRACRERPRRHCAAEQRDELAAFHSITSSARPESGSGTVMPSPLAILRLIISSTFVDCWTGRSAGFSPLRMRPVLTPTRRFASETSAP